MHKCLVAQSCPFVIPWTVDCQAPLSTGLLRQEYCSALPFSPPGDLPNPGIEPVSPILQVDKLSHQGSPLMHSTYFLRIKFCWGSVMEIRIQGEKADNIKFAMVKDVHKITTIFKFD